MTGPKLTQELSATEALLFDEEPPAASEWAEATSGTGTAAAPDSDGGDPRARAAEEKYEEVCAHVNAGETVNLAALAAACMDDRQLHRMLETDSFLRAIADLIPSDSDLSWLSPGEHFGPFTIVRELGRGAFAQVYLATEATTGDRPVVLKVTFGDVNEAQMLGRLSHDNIVPVLSAGRHPTGLLVVCMPYRGSATLQNVLDRAYAAGGAPPCQASVILDAVRAAAKPNDPELELGAPAPYLKNSTWIDGTVRIGEQLATALAFVHAHRIYHCDLKPSNILLDAAGRPLLLDFNLSKDQRLDRSHVGGTLPYMSAEQLRVFLRGNDDVEEPDGRADLFALGVILYELLTGQHPFGKLPDQLAPERAALLLLRRQKAGCTPVRHHNPQVDRGLAALIESCLAFEAADRPRDAHQLAAALRRRFAPSRRLRNRLCLAAALLLVVGGAVAPIVPRVLAAIKAPSPSLPPLTSEEEYKLGRAAYDAGNFTEADGCLERALDADSKNVIFLFARGRSRLALGDASGAKEYFEKARQQRQNDPHILAALAHSELLVGQPQWALQHLNDAEKAGFAPTAAFYQERAHARLLAPPRKEADYQQVFADLQQALTKDPDYAPAHYTRMLAALHKYGYLEQAWTKKDVGLFPQALADTQSVLNEYGSYAEVHQWAGQVYAALAEGPDSPFAKEGINQWRQAVALGWSKANLKGAAPALVRLGENDCLKALEETEAPKVATQVKIPRAELFRDPGVHWLEQ
jgi:serine/threonine protein kinase